MIYQSDFVKAKKAADLGGSAAWYHVSINNGVKDNAEMLNPLLILSLQ
jgi:hypothetical protein